MGERKGGARWREAVFWELGNMRRREGLLLPSFPISEVKVGAEITASKKRVKRKREV